MQICKKICELIMKLDYSKHQHFSFDLWLTLIKSNPEFKSKRNQLFKDFFEINCSIEKVTEVVRYYDVLCNTINEKTGSNIDTFEIYNLILSALNIDVNTIEIQILNQFYKETELLFLEYKPVLIYPEIGKLFAEITQQQKTINVLSNTGFIKGKTLRKLLLHYELDTCFSFQIYSDQAGLSKPNPALFELVYGEIKSLKSIEKKEILHIGDNIRADYNGAMQFGFDALLIKI